MLRFLVLLTLALAACAPRTPVDLGIPDDYKTQAAGDWVGLSGNIWANVAVYYGDAKALCCWVVGGDESCDAVSSGRGILVRFENGTTEWKDRSAWNNSGIYFVKADDPALKAQEWASLDCP